MAVRGGAVVKRGGVIFGGRDGQTGAIIGRAGLSRPGLLGGRWDCRRRPLVGGGKGTTSAFVILCGIMRVIRDSSQEARQQWFCVLLLFSLCLKGALYLSRFPSLSARSVISPRVLFPFALSLSFFAVCTLFCVCFV